MDNYNHSAIHGFPTKTTNVNVLILFMVQLKASRNLNIEIFSPIVIIVTRSDKWAQSKTLKKQQPQKQTKKDYVYVHVNHNPHHTTQETSCVKVIERYEKCPVFKLLYLLVYVVQLLNLLKEFQ